ncbi:MAG: dihydroorotate dehydrogenase (quinone), partial [Rhodospirillales bacterium]|nr:dihydroorotate dehydrogenase (quinone) [Rhodospirillales bacterium]
LPPETAHNAALTLLRLGRPPAPPPPDPALAVNLWGLRFPTPLGLAAGFDKDVRCPDAAGRLGLGFGEAGTVTPEPQPGNPKP